MIPKTSAGFSLGLGKKALKKFEYMTFRNEIGDTNVWRYISLVSRT
jgi:hypothetical protein